MHSWILSEVSFCVCVHACVSVCLNFEAQTIVVLFFASGSLFSLALGSSDMTLVSFDNVLTKYYNI